ncbi:S10 family peptidase [Agrococcus carbonis]|uniref:Carboxypeptidase C (Cathepsin A) n=1 Tax=Agrococcus carbonis TaxID=684552 RepID=A0A1H1SRZ4_9MICO|nr:peptidase S10 [Agrococcus carbonis]SDS50777.1 Carboxypeptidase C (cathepsin A) [Agrococcus carbonis]
MSDDAKQPESAKQPDPVVTDELVTTRHTLTTPEGELAYTARAGRVVLWREHVEDDVFQGRKPRAQVAITSYTLDGADPTTRPVTFAFNGGPGSASVWLHMGVLGPKRVLMGDAGELLPPPYGIADNPESLLAVSDLVFIDPVSTGRSRAVEGQKPKDFHGFTADIESVAEIIRQWVSAEGRWLSPKFLAGESYGTTRAAGLAQLLQEELGMYLNGLLLISSVLDFSTANFERGGDRAHAMYLPFYAATAWRHGFHEGRSLEQVVDEARAYAARDYPYVLGRGARLTEDERADAVAAVARLTGLSEDYVDRADLRIEHWRYFGELLREQGRTVGRLDSRFTGPAASGIAEHMDADPSMDAILGPYAAAYQHYLHHDLEVRDTGPFHVFGKDVIEHWSYKEFENAPVYVIDRLSRAMRQNPHLAVHFAYGWFDGATPFSAAEDSVAHLQIPEELRDNLEHRYYEAGHMMYVHGPSRIAQSADLADFVRRRSGRAG